MFTIRKAQETDLDKIMVFVEKTITIMKTENNPQWDETYPLRSDFSQDIHQQELFVCEENDAVLGMICINCAEPIEYDAIDWSQNQKSTIIHRMAVAPESRGKGVGAALMAFAETVARENHTFYLKTDTYGTNVGMNALVQKNGYILCGQMYFKGKTGKFNCFDKILTQ